MKARNAAEVAEANTLLDQLTDLQSRTLAILKAAEKAKDHNVSLKAISEARRNLELVGKLAGELAQGNQINIINSPEWVNLQTIILEVLSEYPEARLHLVEALECQEVKLN